jgi:serine phosphatase RsbU (regulator of sigma subunit)
MGSPLEKLPEQVRTILGHFSQPPVRLFFLVYDKDGSILHITRHPEVFGDRSDMPASLSGIFRPGHDTLDEKIWLKSFFPENHSTLSAIILMPKAENWRLKLSSLYLAGDIPALVKVGRFGDLFMASVFPHLDFMDRLTGRLTYDLAAVLNENNEIIMFNEAFTKVIDNVDESGRLFMEQFTDPRDWFKLLARRETVLEYYRKVVEANPALWKPLLDFGRVDPSLWIQDTSSSWRISENSFSPLTEKANSYLTYLDIIEQVKNDVMLEFETDLSKLESMGVMFCTNIYHAATDTSTPDAQGYNLQIAAVGGNPACWEFRLKKAAYFMDSKKVPAREVLEGLPAGLTNIKAAFEKSGGVFTVSLNGRKVMTLYDDFPITRKNTNYLGIIGKGGVSFRNLRILTRPSRFEAAKIPPETMDLRFYRLPGQIYETRIGKYAMGNKSLKYVYMKDATYSRELLDRVNKYVREIDEELATASRIQMHLANVKIPGNADTRFAYCFMPCHKVGGDMLDIKELGPGKYGVLIYDVSGHGIAASLISSMAKMSFDTAFKQGLSPAAMTSRVNREICEVTDPSIFITAFLAVIDLGARRLTYSRAGHCIPAIFSKTRTRPVFLEQGSPILGNEPDFEFYEEQVALETGDRLVIFTDGITEIRNNEDRFFDRNGLFGIINATLDLPVEKVKDRLLDGIRAFRGHGSYEDDITFLLADLLKFPEQQ